MKARLLIASLTALAAITLSGCAGTSGGDSSNPSSTTANGWSCQYCKGVALKASGAKNFSFTFPKSDGVHHVVKPFSVSKSAKTITATFTVTPGKFVAAGGGKPRLGLYFRSCPGWDALGDDQYCRWYSNPNAVRLVPEIVGKGGTFKLLVPLTPGMWSSVLGKFGDEVPDKFNAAKTAMTEAGFVVGDDFGFAHGGWDLTGKAQFTLTSFEAK